MENCETNGPNAERGDSLERLKGYGAEAAGVENDEGSPTIQRTPRIRDGQNGGGEERGTQRRGRGL